MTNHLIEFDNLIKSRLGLVITHQRGELQQAIEIACQKFHCTPNEYLVRLKECDNDSPMMEHLISAITIGETYFFRDKNQVKILLEFVLPDLIAKKRAENNLTLRIWSAGCSSGEEIYTLAMMLNELLPDINHWVLNLLATDINKNALQKAMDGIYTEWSMRAISPYYKQKFFHVENNRYCLNENIKSSVEFQFLNLCEDEFPSILNGTNAQDIIICRNVLIYFDDEHVKKVMKKINASLVPEGYLLLGASDPIQLSHTNLIHHPQKSTLFVVKREQATPMPRQLERVHPVVKLPTHSKPSVPSIIINKPMTQLSDITSLANLGKLKECEMACKECIALNHTDVMVHFTYALVQLELGKLDECEMSLRKALYLDNHFVNGFYHLGLLLLKQNRYKEGIKCLKNALKIAKKDEKSGRLVTILESELELYQEKESSHEE